MKITKKEIRELISEFFNKDSVPPNIKTNIDIEGLLGSERTKVLNMLEVEAEVIIRLLPRPDITRPLAPAYVYLDNDIFPLSTLKDYWEEIVKFYDDDSNKIATNGFFNKGKDEGPSVFIKEALSMYCGDYDRVVIRDVSSGDGVNLVSEDIPLKTTVESNANGFFYRIMTNLSNSPTEVASEQCVSF